MTAGRVRPLRHARAYTPEPTLGPEDAPRNGGLAAEVVGKESQEVTLHYPPSPARVVGGGQPEEAEVMAMSEDEEEVEQCRPPNS